MRRVVTRPAHGRCQIRETRSRGISGNLPRSPTHQRAGTSRVQRLMQCQNSKEALIKMKRRESCAHALLRPTAILGSTVSAIGFACIRHCSRQKIYENQYYNKDAQNMGILVKHQGKPAPLPPSPSVIHKVAHRNRGELCNPQEDQRVAYGIKLWDKVGQ